MKITATDLLFVASWYVAFEIIGRLAPGLSWQRAAAIMALSALVGYWAGWRRARITTAARVRRQTLEEVRAETLRTWEGPKP